MLAYDTIFLLVWILGICLVGLVFYFGVCAVTKLRREKRVYEHKILEGQDLYWGTGYSMFFSLVLSALTGFASSMISDNLATDFFLAASVEFLIAAFLLWRVLCTIRNLHAYPSPPTV